MIITIENYRHQTRLMQDLTREAEGAQAWKSFQAADKWLADVITVMEMVDDSTPAGLTQEEIQTNTNAAQALGVWVQRVEDSLQ